jgi:hypothetical protein
MEQRQPQRWKSENELESQTDIIIDELGHTNECGNAKTDRFLEIAKVRTRAIRYSDMTSW